MPSSNIPNPIVTDMNKRISDLEKSHISISNILFKLAEIELDNNRCLKRIIELEEDKVDEGKQMISSGTVSSTAFTVIDTQISPGHPVKGYSVANTGNNNLFFAYNITRQPQVDADIVDTLKADPIFITLTPGERDNFGFVNQCIKSFHLLAVTGTTTYKMKMAW